MCQGSIIRATQCGHTVHFFSFCTSAVQACQEADHSDIKICPNPTCKGRFPADIHCSEECCHQWMEGSDDPVAERAECEFACRLVPRDFGPEELVEGQPHYIEDSEGNERYRSGQYADYLRQRSDLNLPGSPTDYRTTPETITRVPGYEDMRGSALSLGPPSMPISSDGGPNSSNVSSGSSNKERASSPSENRESSSSNFTTRGPSELRTVATPSEFPWELFEGNALDEDFEDLSWLRGSKRDH